MTSIMISVDLEEGTAMKRKASKKAVAAIILCAAVTLAAVPTAIFFIRGNNSGVQLPAGFEEELSAQAFENFADVRIMSSNLLVHYKSWGGTPAKPRAKQYTKMLELYSPDVVGIQEMSDSWYCLLRNNLPKKYKMLFRFRAVRAPIHSPCFHMTASQRCRITIRYSPILRCDNRYIFFRSLAVSGDFYFSRRLSSNIPPFLDKCPIGV